MNRVVRALLRRRFTTPNVLSSNLDEMLKLRALGDEDVHACKESEECYHKMILKMEQDQQMHFEDMHKERTSKKQQLMKIMHKYNVRLPEIALDDIIDWRDESHIHKVV